MQYCEVINKKNSFRIRGFLHNIGKNVTNARIKERSDRCKAKIGNLMRIGSGSFLEKIHPIPINIEDGSNIEPMIVHRVHDSNHHCINPEFQILFRWKTSPRKGFKAVKDAILPCITMVAGTIVTTGALLLRNVVSGITKGDVQEVSITNINGGLHRLMPRRIAQKMEYMKFPAFTQEKEDP